MQSQMLLSPMLMVVMALSTACVLAGPTAETTSTPDDDLLRTAPDGVLMKICIDHLDLKSTVAIWRTCRNLHRLLSPTRRAVHDLFNEDIPESEFHRSLQLFAAFPPDLSGRVQPRTALALYDRCPAGRYDILATLIERVHPIVFGALVASQPENDQAMRDVLALASRCTPLTLPALPSWFRESFLSILNDILHTIKAKLNPELHSALSQLGDPFCRIFPHHEQVAERLLTKFRERGCHLQLANADILLALTWRGIRFPARTFMSVVGRDRNFQHHTEVYPLLRIEETPEHLLLTLKESLMDVDEKYRGCQLTRFSTCPELRRRLERLLQCSLETFPWALFCQIFELEDQSAHASTLSSTLLQLASIAERRSCSRLAECLRSSAAVHGPADSEVVKAALKDMCRSRLLPVTPAQFEWLLQGQHYCHDCLLDTICYVLDLDMALGPLFAHFLAMSDVRDLLCTTRRATLVRAVTNAIAKDYSFYVDHLEHFLNIPEIVTALYEHKMKFVHRLGSSLSDTSAEAPAGLQAAMRLHFWREIANLSDEHGGATLLHWAYFYKSQAAARLLLSDPFIDRKCVDQQGYGPLRYYLTDGKVLNEFVYFLQGLPIEDADYHDQIVKDIECVFETVQLRAVNPLLMEPDFIPSLLKLEIMQPLLETHGSRLYAIAAKYHQQHLIPAKFRPSESVSKSQSWNALFCFN